MEDDLSSNLTNNWPTSNQQATNNQPTTNNNQQQPTTFWNSEDQDKCSAVEMDNAAFTVYKLWDVKLSTSSLDSLFPYWKSTKPV